MGNICKCPPPSGNTITCSPDEAATCYTDGQGNSHGACYPLSSMGIASRGDWDQMTNALAKTFSRDFRISLGKFIDARWTTQTLPSNETVVSVHFSDFSAINITFPPGVLTASAPEERSVGEMSVRV